MSKLAARKREHLAALARDAEIERGGSGFSALRFTHRALPELDFDAIDTRTTFLGKPLRFPLLISSMTGGRGAEMTRINRHLAEAAEHCGVALAVGSQRIQFLHPESAESFALRPFAPSVPLLSNLGAVQLNDGFTHEHGQRALETLGADGLYLHLNPLQEAIQPEGDRNFSGLVEKIAQFAAALPVPVLLKEVGCGLSPEDIARGKSAGIRYFDLAGRGGTSWSRIEYHRRREDDDDLGLVFQDWGLSTVTALQAARAAHPEVTLIASGGIRTGIDIAKALALGASLCGVAAPLIRPAQESTAAVVRILEKFRREYQTALFLLGCASTAELYNQSSLLIKE